VILTGGLDFHSFSSTYKPTRLTPLQQKFRMIRRVTHRNCQL
jgi:hypothetical protein